MTAEKVVLADSGQVSASWTDIFYRQLRRHPWIGSGLLGSLLLFGWFSGQSLFILSSPGMSTVLGYAVALAPGVPAKKRFAGFLAAVTSEENDYFLRSFDALGVAAYRLDLDEEAVGLLEEAAEAERAKRVPISLTAGRLPRPIPGPDVVAPDDVEVQPVVTREELLKFADAVWRMPVIAACTAKA